MWKNKQTQKLGVGQRELGRENEFKGTETIIILSTGMKKRVSIIRK